MKKIIYIALSIMMIVTSLSLSACSDASTENLENKIAELETVIENQTDTIEEIKTELEKTNKLIDENFNDIVKLTADNYDNYISINLHYGDCFYINKNDSNALYCTGYIKLAKNSSALIPLIASMPLNSVYVKLSPPEMLDDKSLNKSPIASPKSFKAFCIG